MLDPAVLKQVEQELVREWVRGGDILCRQGDPGDSLYVLIQGRLSVSVTDDEGRERVISEIGRGEVVGEMALLSGDSRSATIRAVRDSELVKFTQHAFETIVEKNPKVITAITRRLIVRLRETSQASFRSKLATLAIVPWGGPVPLTEIADKVEAAFSRLGSTLRLNSEKIKAFHVEGTDLSAVLDQQEEHYQYIIYEADPEATEWTNLCIRQADRIMPVADGGGHAMSSGVDTEMHLLCASKSTAKKELVIFHADATVRPRDTQQWLKTLGPEDKYHHVRMSSEADFDRLARILTGNAIGLVLGGGGARGFAHIGVLRAFAEAGIPIDMIAGTSMGSVVAAQYAMGHDFDSMLALNRKGWLDMDPLKDKTIPVMAMLACRKLDAMIEMMFDDVNIEDLWLKFFCVSANLTQAKMMVHADGPLAWSVRASMAIPGVAVPVFSNGDLLVDGGVLNNLPGDIMRQFCGGSVVVVDVSPQKGLTVDPQITKAPSSSSVIWSRINPLKETIHVPSVLAIMTRTIMLGSTQSSQEVAKQSDLYIRPPIDDFGIFEWNSLDKLAEVGYEFGRKTLAEWIKTRSANKVVTPTY